MSGKKKRVRPLQCRRRFSPQDAVVATIVIISAAYCSHVAHPQEPKPGPPRAVAGLTPQQATTTAPEKLAIRIRV